MNKNEIWEQIKNDKTTIYGQSMLDIFLQTTNTLELDHYLELDYKQKKLINDAKLAYELAVMRGANGPHDRPGLEKIIMKDPLYAYLYANHVIEGRWKEAEPIIMKDPHYAYYYAVNIIKKRWIEAEETIKENTYWWNRYTKHFKI